MNKQQKQINKSIKKVMQKITCFSIDKVEFSEGNFMYASLRPSVIWVWLHKGDDVSSAYIKIPTRVGGIYDFELEVDRLLARFKKSGSFNSCDSGLFFPLL